MDHVVRTLARSYSVEPTDENAHRLASMVCRTVDDDQTHHVIIRPSHGGGWSTRVNVYNPATIEEASEWYEPTLFLIDYARAIRRLLLTFEPLVAAIVAPGPLTVNNPAVPALASALGDLQTHYEGMLPDVDPSIANEFMDEFSNYFSLEHALGLYPSRYLNRLRVVEVTGPFIVREYDGSESVISLQSFLDQAIIL